MGNDSKVHRRHCERRNGKVTVYILFDLCLVVYNTTDKKLLHDYSSSHKSFDSSSALIRCSYSDFKFCFLSTSIFLYTLSRNKSNPLKGYCCDRSYSWHLKQLSFKTRSDNKSCRLKSVLIRWQSVGQYCQWHIRPLPPRHCAFTAFY